MDTIKSDGKRILMKDPENWLKPELVAMLFRDVKEHSYRNWLILTLLLKTGRRIGELLQLKHKNIDFDTGMILWNIEKKKRDFKKWKAIDKRSLYYLGKYIESEQIQPEEYVFFSPYKGREYHLSRQSVWIFLQKYSKKLDSNIHPHTFRHTFSVWIVQNMEHAGDLVKLKNLLEHSDIKMTEQYLQFSTKETKELLEKTFKEHDNSAEDELKN